MPVNTTPLNLLLAAPSDVLQNVYTPFMRTGQRIAGTAQTCAEIRAVVRREHPDGLVVFAPLDAPDPETLVALLLEVNLPTAVLLPPTWQAAAFASVPRFIALEPNTTWPVITGALESLVRQPAPTPSVRPAAYAASVTPAPTPPAVSPAARSGGTVAGPTQRVARSTADPIIVLHAAVGGVGASTLALSLAAAGAEIGVASLTVTADVLPLVARLGFPPAERARIREIAPYLAAVVVEGDWTPPAGYELIAWDMWRGSETLVRQHPVLIITRPTGDGRLAAIQAAHELTHLRGTLAGICLSGRGSLGLSEFARSFQEHNLRTALWELPDDPTVYLTSEEQGHALAAPRYGAAVRTLARQLWPALPWPAEEEKEPRRRKNKPDDAAAVATAPGTKLTPVRPRRKLLELVD